MFFTGEKMLLMGSSKYREEELPPEIQDIIDTAIDHEMTFIVAEVHGSCRLFQDYLAGKKYGNGIPGPANNLARGIPRGEEYKPSSEEPSIVLLPEPSKLKSRGNSHI